MIISTLDLPKAEQDFKVALEQWYVDQGVPREHSLFDFWVDASGPRTHLAGERIAREISSIVSLEGKLVLDVGCGFGGALAVLARHNAEAFGIDLSQNELALCKRRLGLHFLDCLALCGDAFRMPFCDAYFDVVICTEMFEHIKERAALIQELARVLKRGGLLYLSFPNFLSIRNIIKDPHYQLLGATLMPLPIARWYTRLRRGRNYDVELLPFPTTAVRFCKKSGIRVYYLNVGEEVLLRKIDAPETIRNPTVRAVAKVLSTLGLKWLVRMLLRLRGATTSSVVLAGFKQ